MLCPRPLQIDVPFSFVFTRLKWASWFQFLSRLTPAAPRREEDGILGSVLTDVPFSSVTFFMTDLDMAALQVSSLLL